LTEQISVKITRTGHDRHDLPLPLYATEGSAGMDICAAVDQDVELAPGQTALVPTGFSIELPLGYEAQIRPRSGLAIKHQIGLMNAPGTIDSDYRGEVRIVVTNFGTKPFVVKRGDRIAQMIVARYSRVQWDEVEELEGSQRGSGGFGHTGVTKEGTR